MPIPVPVDVRAKGRGIQILSIGQFGRPFGLRAGFNIFPVHFSRFAKFPFPFPSSALLFQRGERPRCQSQGGQPVLIPFDPLQAQPFILGPPILVAIAAAAAATVTVRIRV